MAAALLALTLLAGGPGGGDVRAWRAAHEVEIVRELADLLAIPNVASDSANIERNAEAIRAAYARRGIAMELLRSPGAPPAVFGERRVPGASRTIVFYAHYDGQPVVPAQWTGEPWKPVLRDKSLRDGGREIAWDGIKVPLDPEWRVYARSASDDKAPIVGLLAALDALSAAGRAPTANLKFFFEGEEEAGSPHLERILRDHADKLRGDLWLLLDGPVHQTRRMALFFGARGVTDVEMTVYGPSRPPPQRPLRELGRQPDRGARAAARLDARRRGPHPRRGLLGRRASSDRGREARGRRGASGRVGPRARAPARPHGGRRRAADRADPAAGDQHPRHRERRRRRVGHQRDSHGGARVDRLPPRSRSDAREGPREDRGARAAAGLHDRARGPDAGRAPVEPAAREARLGRGLPGGTHAARRRLLARRDPDGRGGRRPDGRPARRSAGASRCISSATS